MIRIYRGKGEAKKGSGKRRKVKGGESKAGAFLLTAVRELGLLDDRKKRDR